MTKKIITHLTILIFVTSLFAWQPALADAPSVLITEVQTGLIDSSGNEHATQEFIELANVSPANVNVTGWTVEYLSAAHTGIGSPTSVLNTLSGQIAMDGQVLLSHAGYNPAKPDGVMGEGDESSSGLLAKSGGHIRLMNGDTMVDCVAWGSASVIAGCDKVSAVAPAGYTLQRPMVNNLYDKSRGVANLTPPNPRGGGMYPVNEPDNDPTCDHVQLSEIVANPAGDDTQAEFIELYNPTNQPQTLYGCSLRLSNGKEYSFLPTDRLAPQQYKAYSYSVTGLTLSNSGMSVTLSTASQQITTTYPAVGDDDAWALVKGSWGLTNQPTPDLANLPNQLDASDAASSLVLQLEPCAAGKYRSLETGRCRNIVETASVPASCMVGQELNPATGRCRKIVVASAPVACQPDQERNPETGRCRKITPVAAVQQPCDPGQERNPETNRCRKVVAPPSGKVLGDATASKRSYNHVLVGGGLAMVLAYGVYEYHPGILGLIDRLRRKKVSL